MIVAYLLAAAAFEIVLALRHSTSPHGEGFVLLFAVVAMLAGAGLVFRPVLARALFAPVAAFFVTARFYTGDPYYGSTFRRYADGGIFAPTWIYALLGLALAAGAMTQFWRRTVPVETIVVLLLLAFTALFIGTGH
jgi:drug/metabolite transporter (DMT)-like permease